MERPELTWHNEAKGRFQAEVYGCQASNSHSKAAKLKTLAAGEKSIRGHSGRLYSSLNKKGNFPEQLFTTGQITDLHISETK